MASTEEGNEDEEATYGDVEEVKAETGVPKTIANAYALCDELQITMETSLRTRDALGALTDAKLDWFSKKFDVSTRIARRRKRNRHRRGSQQIQRVRVAPAWSKSLHMRVLTYTPVCNSSGLLFSMFE